MMTYLSLAFSAGCPVVTAVILTVRECSPVGLGAGEDVMFVGRIAHAVHRIEALGRRLLLVNPVIAAMKLLQVRRNQ